MDFHETQTKAHFFKTSTLSTNWAMPFYIRTFPPSIEGAEILGVSRGDFQGGKPVGSFDI